MLFILLMIAVPALSWGATISGTVRDSMGAAITGDEIAISVYTGDPCGSHNYVAGTSTDSVDGTYSVDGLPAGTYYLQTWHNETNYQDEWWNGSSPDPSDHDCSLAQSIAVDLNDTVPGTDFWLDTGATISGTVRDSTGTPITGDELFVEVYTGDPCSNYQTVGGMPTNSSDGTFTVSGLPPGTYYLKTYRNLTNYVEEWWNGGSPDPSDWDCNLANSITVASGDTVTGTDFWLDIGATISGTVRDSTGTPITGTDLSIEIIAGNDPCNDRPSITWAYSDPADGTYTAVVPAGTFYLKTWRQETNYLDEWWTGSSPDPSDYDCNLAQTITIALEDTVTGIDFWLDIGATVSGTVRDSTGTPITGSRLRVNASSGDPCDDHQHVDGANTDPSDGTYTVVVPAGTYYLQCRHEDTNYIDEWWNGDSPDPSDFDCSLANSITVASGDTVTGTDFWLDIGATISGTVRDNTGTPVTGDQLTVQAFAGDPCGDNHWVDYSFTNTADGTYTVVVPPGAYYIRTWHRDTAYLNEWWNGGSPDPSDYDCSLASSITVVSGDTITGTDFWLDIGATISGTVRDSTGTPITADKIEVSAFTGDPCAGYDHVEGNGTNNDGTYMLVVPAGT